MEHEFGKIFSSIVINAVLLIILRFIINHSVDDVNNLVNEYRPTNEEARHQAWYNKFFIIKNSKNFNSKMTCRYIIAIVIMLIFIGFFFYYNTVFCGVYGRASPGWVYSGLWCLILVWFLFSPVFIFLLAIIEHNSKENNCCNCIYTWISFTLEFVF